MDIGSNYPTDDQVQLSDGSWVDVIIASNNAAVIPFFNEKDEGAEGAGNHVVGVSTHEVCHHFDYRTGSQDAMEDRSSNVNGPSAGIGNWGRRKTQMHPRSRWKMSWGDEGILEESNPTLVEPDIRLNDYVTNPWENMFIIEPLPHHAFPYPNEQYFILSYHTESHWVEYGLPFIQPQQPEIDSGMLIWHVNEDRNTNRDEQKKWIDVECAEGLWNDTACNGTDPNEVTGRDKLDFFGGGATNDCGSRADASNLFIPNDQTFDMASNPSTDFHRPSESIYQDVHSGIAVRNIRFIDDNGEKYALVDIYRNWYGGELLSDLTLQGEVIIGADLYVQDNHTLTIAPGATLTFEDNASIIVESDGFVEINQTQTIADGSSFIVNGGTVTIADNSKIIMGTSSNELDINSGSTIRLGTLSGIEINSMANINGATFTSTYTTPTTGQYWSSIRLNDSASDNSTITDNTIQYARSGIHCYRSSPTIARNDILDISNYGIRLDYSEADVQANTVERAFHGIYIISGSPYLHLNQILDCTSTGMYTTFYSAPRLFVNTIDGTDYNGVYASYYSAPEFGYTISGADDGRNEIINNDIGIYAHNSMPFLGGSTVGGEQVGGGNCIEDNTSYHVYAVSNANVEAEYNWWGAGVTSAMFNDLTLIDWTPILSDSPCDGSNPGTLSIAGLTEPNENDPDGLWQWALALGHSQQANEAIGIYKMLIRRFSAHPQAKWALMQLVKLYPESEIAGLHGYLNGLTNFPGLDESLRQMVFDFLLETERHEGFISQAITTGQHILDTYPDTESEKGAMFTLCQIYCREMNDEVQTIAMLDLLLEKYPDDGLTELAQLDVATAFGYEEASAIVLSPGNPGLTRELPSDFALLQNYPNPFNPTTVISFQLPAVSRINLSVYNTAGQLVKRLASGNREPGTHEVVWDGKNETGQEVGSGIYFYRLQTDNGYNETRSMILLK